MHLMFRFCFIFFHLSYYFAYEIWPLPQKITEHREIFYTIDPLNFEFVFDESCEIIESAIARYKSRTFVQDCSLLNYHLKGKYFHNQTIKFNYSHNYLGQLTKIHIEFENECESLPNPQMDESYEIEINSNPKRIQLLLANRFGVLLEMVQHIGLNQFRINVGYIHDHPRYDFRGFLIDSSRHFLPLRSIFKMIDAMEMNKMNVLHWHIVDDQSFPFVSVKFPNLSKKGAYLHRYTYSFKDVNRVIEYAALRGIRVMPEFDTPGHTRSWGKGQKELLTQCYNKGKPKPNVFGPINPILNTTYEFLKEFFTEISHRFPDQWMHLGGDEVDLRCWESNPYLQAFVKEKKFSNFKQLENFYIQKLIEIVGDFNRTYVFWEEVFNDGVKLDRNSIVHFWKSRDFTAAIKAKQPILYSSCWYLNYIQTGADWVFHYTCDPRDFNGTEQEKALVLGGAACIWGEFVDGSNLISRSWPRGAAVAERLWSPKMGTESYSKAEHRFNRQRCRMQMLGLNVEPANGPGYCNCDDAYH
ncbi:Beta-hexosaminidase subunit beta [Sarcoptes scabiei]|uniref:Beta-hexosaminidase n=1 Tax=Sarcoptes scabiei TaxID=52283 RepID=A0A834RC42_SARSC|nr:Beta-hexosaminidase subunit beta [Sarcoptes scabiei]